MTDFANLSGSRVLVTGGSGFVGRHFVKSLSDAGAKVRVIDLLPHPNAEVEVVIGDIADRAAVEKAYQGGIDYVVHLAAETSVLKSVGRPEETFHTNLAGTHRILEGARTGGVKALVFADSNAIIGPMEEPKITERARLRPMTPYGATKAAGEMLMSAYTACYGVRCTALRLTNVYGPGMAAKDSIVARLMRGIRMGKGFEIYGDGTQVRDYIHAYDVVAAGVMALTDEAWSGPVVLGAGVSHSVLEVVDVVKQVTGADFEVTHGPARPGEMPAVIVDTAHAHELGWAPKWNFHDGVAGVWEEWKTIDIEGAQPAA